MTHFRLNSQLWKNPRFMRLSHKNRSIFVCLASLYADGQLIQNYTEGYEEDVAASLRITDEEWVEARDQFLERGFIELCHGGYKVSGCDGLGLNVSRLGGLQWQRLRAQVFERDNYTCQYCGATDKDLHCDHIIPVSKGGLNTLNNLTTACSTCNHSKGDKPLEEWRSA